MVGCGGGLLKKAVQENDVFVLDEEDGAGDAIREAGAHFPKAATKRVHLRQAERPAKLNRLDVSSDAPAFIPWQGLQPFAHRFIARCGAIEVARKRT